MTTRPKKTSKKRALESTDYGDQLVSVVEHGLGATLRLSKGAMAFARALHDPFDSDLTPRFPVLPILPTMVGRVFAHIDQSVANTNHCLLVNPARVVANDSSSYAVYVGGSGTTNPLPNDLSTMPAGWAAGVVANGPRPLSDFFSSATAEPVFYARLNALGIRVRYTGTELARGGTIYTLCNPTLGNLSNQVPGSPPTGYTPAQVITNTTAFQVHPVKNGQWTELTFPIRYQEQERFVQYNGDRNRWTYIGTDQSGVSDATFSILDALSVFIWMKLPAVATVEWQIHGYFEYYGRRVISGSSYATPDPQGVGLVTGHHVATQHAGSPHESGMGIVPFATPERHRKGGLGRSLLHFAKSGLTHFAPKLEKAAVRAAKALIG